MVAPCSNFHDSSAKTLMNGFQIPAGGTTRSDLDAALQHIYDHPNMGPFLAVRMIRHFVTSHPSPGYVQRVATTFDDNGSGVRGDLQAVIQAVLLDPEATSSDPLHGHLREQILYANALVRTLGVTVEEQNPLAVEVAEIGQRVFSPPSVFNYFHLAHGTFHGAGHMQADGPEFQNHTFVTAIGRADLVYRILHNKGGYGATFDDSPWLALAGDPAGLVDAVIRAMLPDPLSATERQIIIDAVNSVSPGNPARRVEYAIYLTAVTRMQVQH